MRKIVTSILLLAVFTVLFIAPSAARSEETKGGFRQPKDERTVSAEAAKKLSNGGEVILRGHIVRRASAPYFSSHYYVFKDYSGEIVVDIENHVWGGLQVGAKDAVELEGEIEIGFRGLRVKVSRVRVLAVDERDNSNGEVVVKPVSTGRRA